MTPPPSSVIITWLLPLLLWSSMLRNNLIQCVQTLSSFSSSSLDSLNSWTSWKTKHTHRMASSCLWSWLQGEQVDNEIGFVCVYAHYPSEMSLERWEKKREKDRPIKDDDDDGSVLFVWDSLYRPLASSLSLPLKKSSLSSNVIVVAVVLSLHLILCDALNPAFSLDWMNEWAEKE